MIRVHVAAVRSIKNVALIKDKEMECHIHGSDQDNHETNILIYLLGSQNPYPIKRCPKYHHVNRVRRKPHFFVLY